MAKSTTKQNNSFHISQFYIYDHKILYYSVHVYEKSFSRIANRPAIIKLLIRRFQHTDTVSLSTGSCPKWNVLEMTTCSKCHRLSMATHGVTLTHTTLNSLQIHVTLMHKNTSDRFFHRSNFKTTLFYRTVGIQSESSSCSTNYRKGSLLIVYSLKRLKHLCTFWRESRSGQRAVLWSAIYYFLLQIKIFIAFYA